MKVLLGASEMSSEPSSGAPDAVLRAVAGELSLLQGISHDLETALINTVNEVVGDELAPVKRQVMQDFDLLAQSLDGLRTYLDELAVAAIGSEALAVGSALDTIKLGAMRNRLSKGSLDIVDDEPSGDPRGDIDLF